MSDIAVRVENLSKQYKIAAVRRRHDTLKDMLADGLKSPFRRKERSDSNNSVFWALKNIAFEVKQGEAVGIIGRNGAGKSTLLKILSRITKPSGGRAEIFGRVGSLLEVGTGFDRELTGRENTYLSGAILGMKKAEIDRKFDEIVSFAEVEEFIDTPLKHYSSGMYLRLAFAVAAHLEPEILLVDEVLAVGDASFQKRCLGKMEEVSTQGRTILFVSHNMAAITHFCKWGIWLNGGQMEVCANIEEIVARYLTSGVQECGEISFSDDLSQVPGSEYVRLSAVRIRDRNELIASSLDVRHPFSIEIEYRVLRRVKNLRIGLRLLGHDGFAILSSTDMDDSEGEMEREPGKYTSRCCLPGDFLNYGQYFVSIGSDFPMMQVHFTLDRALAFQVESTGGVGGSIPDGRSGILRVRLPWKIQKSE
jgi:lipopolysaccharide transport system ATP-binding protein